MPNHASRLGKAQAGELDAILDEGILVWANQLAEAGMHFLPLAASRLVELEQRGFRRGTIEQTRYLTLPADVPTVDFSGWPIYTRVDTPDLLVREFCAGLEANQAQQPWQMGSLPQAPLPLARIVQESLDVPLHAAARQFWQQCGYVS